jgi:uncharacterized protein (DUF302 family)
MSYSIARSLAGAFDAVLSKVTAQLKACGFGVLTDIDMQATMKAKLGADMPRRILGACNPRTAVEAIKAEESVEVPLPCNEVVRDAPEGRVEVAGIDPVSSMERTGNTALQAHALEPRRLLTLAINSVEG